MEGWVFKWVNFIKGWQPRYVSLDLESNTLNFLKTLNDPLNVKKLNLLNAVIIDEKKKKNFLIEYPDKKIYIKTNTDDEKKAWISKLIESKNYRKNSIFTNNIIDNKNFQEKETFTFKKSESYVYVDNSKNGEKQIVDDYIQNLGNDTINIIPQNQRFSDAFKTYHVEINKNKNSNSKFDLVINNYQNLQNLFFELNFAMEDFNLNLMSKKNSKEKEELTKIYTKFFNIKLEMKQRLDLSMKSIFDYKEEVDKLNINKDEIKIGEDYIHNKEFMFDKNLEQNNEDKIKTHDETFYCVKEDEDEEININNENMNVNLNDNSFDNSNENNSSFEDCVSFNDNLKPNEDFKINLEKSILSESDENKNRFTRALSKVSSDFYDNSYIFEKRKNLPNLIKCSSSMLSDMLKSLTKDKITLPIHYNEPISMLQRQCEKFQYSYLLNSGAKENSKMLKMIYTAAFMVSELSLNINRILKPFNPILGETFEYIENDSKFRYFSEQVSHNPPISAFICESEDFAVFGDTRCKNKFKIFKRAMELNFYSKTNIIFKNSNDHFVFNKPTVYLKGLIMGIPYYDFSGIVNIEDVNDKNVKIVIDFFEEGRKSKPLGYFEGKCIDLTTNENVYHIYGNWKENFYITDKNNSNKNEIWKISNDDFITNNDFTNNYLISNFACNLNNLPLLDECCLVKKLPVTDSRLRPDQRELENRNLDKAELDKNRIEMNQRNRHKKFEEDKIKYDPNYFAEVFDTKSQEYIYLYKGDYWKDRKNANFSHLYDIFA